MYNREYTYVKSYKWNEKLRRVILCKYHFSIYLYINIINIIDTY